MATMHQARVFTPLSPDALTLIRMTGRERLGRLSKFDVELVGRDESVPFADLLGKDMTVEMELPDGSVRRFHGLVTRFAQVGSEGRRVLYRASLAPWLWFLSRTADCRVFQGASAPDIVMGVFRELGFTDFRDDLTRSYAPRVYCVQYRETDLNFVSRLMEEEGIYYFFEHSEGKHTLVLSDSLSAHSPSEEGAEIPFSPQVEASQREEARITQWQQVKAVEPGAIVLNDYNFEAPRANQRVTCANPKDHAHGEFEVYDYPGLYTDPARGDSLAQARLEEYHTRSHVVRGAGTARGLATGRLFTLTQHPREDQNVEHLVTATEFTVSNPELESGLPDDAPVYSVRFEAIPSRQRYVTPRMARRPFVQGPQTAVVVGKAGEEIWTDQHGRVKVQFHWDRYGKNDENSSCWVRVSQPWAGKGWGAVAIPRIGQEVIVDFLEGDPDQPIIVGRVYNADNMPPYALPDNKTQTGIKSRSSKGGSADNFNEIRFEDLKGDELVYIHAEKNQTIVVENDKNENVGHDEVRGIGNDRTDSVGRDEDRQVGRHRTDTVGKNESRTVGDNQTETVGKDQTVTVGENRSVTVGKNETRTVTEVQSISVGKDRSTNVGQNDTTTVSKAFLLDVGDSIVLKTGSAQIVMKKDGTITIEGKDVTINASGKIQAKASKDVILKGSKITSN